MTIKKKKSGLTVVELLVVIGIIAVVVAISLPAFNAMQKSFDSTGAEGMISAALSTARTLAISRQQYVGVRFQKEYSTKSILDTDQYMIFVIYQPPEEGPEPGWADDISLTNMFKAIDGYKPMKLPANVGVIDKTIRDGISDPDCSGAKEDELEQGDLDDSDAIAFNRTITDTSAFSVVFSPAGKLVIHDIRTRSKKGRYQPSDPNASGYDQVFNSETNIKNEKLGQFIQDDYADLGLGGETSRKELVIYNREEFKKLTTAKQRWDYLNDNSKSVYINPYTGGIIEK